MKIWPNNTLLKVDQIYLNNGNGLYYTIKEININNNTVFFYYGKYNNFGDGSYSKFIKDIRIKHFILHK